MKLRKKRTIVYLGIALIMLGYAVPRLPIGGGWTPESIFSVAWVGMALLIIAAHLHAWIGVNDKVEQDIQAIKRYKYWRLHQQWAGQSERDRGGG